jgi:hypothetical protein
LGLLKKNISLTFKSNIFVNIELNTQYNAIDQLHSYQDLGQEDKLKTLNLWMSGV